MYNIQPVSCQVQFEVAHINEPTSFSLDRRYTQQMYTFHRPLVAYECNPR